MKKPRKKKSEKLGVLSAFRVDEKTLHRLDVARVKVSKTRPGVTRSMLVREAIVFWLDHAPELA
jgi:hypothetical protein